MLLPPYLRRLPYPARSGPHPRPRGAVPRPAAPEDGRPAPRGSRPSRAARRATALALVAVAVLGAAAPSAPGPVGIGDRLFPQLGNPGYDVLGYDIALDYSGHNDRPLAAVTTITARATTALDHLNLDFARGTVASVTVGGLPARFVRRGEDVVITPAVPVPAGAPLRIVVRHTSDPRGGDDGGWIRTPDGLAMANQADAAHRVFPCNDHPSDKAYVTFRLTAPRGVTAVAGGVPVPGGDDGPRPTRTFRSAHPVATELAQVSFGKSAVLTRPGPHGLPVRDVVPAAARTAMEPWLNRTPGQIAWMERRVGRFPFPLYGLLIADTRTGFELETQTLSLFEKSLFTEDRLPSWYVESVMVHELAHQWFGDSVSPRRWSDLWLNEAHATWYEALYAQEKGGTRRASLEERMRHAYTESDTWRTDGGPPAAPKRPVPGQKISIFRPVVYDGSALVLYALRQKIGPAAFDRLERAWVTRYRDGNASTADFTALASAVSGRDLSAFLHAWLYDAKTPPMPGHPGWTSRRPK